MNLQAILQYTDRIVKHATRRLEGEKQLPLAERTYHGGYSIGLYKGRIDGYTFAREALLAGNPDAIKTEMARLDATREAVMQATGAGRETIDLTSAQGEALAIYKMTYEALDDVRELIEEESDL